MFPVRTMGGYRFVSDTANLRQTPHRAMGCPVLNRCEKEDYERGWTRMNQLDERGWTRMKKAPRGAGVIGRLRSGSPRLSPPVFLPREGKIAPSRGWLLSHANPSASFTTLPPYFLLSSMNYELWIGGIMNWEFWVFVPSHARTRIYNIFFIYKYIYYTRVET